MTRTGKRLIQDFIIPALDSQKYGELLQWVDGTQRIFQIKWSHKNAARWSSEDTNVFQDWDRLKGHYKPDKEGYYMQAKQRFRAALQKLKNYVRRLDYEEKGFKRYKLLNPEKKQAKNEKEKKKHVRKIVRAIPTSVICHHKTLSYNNGNVTSTSNSSSPSSFLSSSPSSPLSSQSSQESNHSISSSLSILSNLSSENEMLEQNYKSAQERHMRAYEIDASMNSDQKENLESQTQRSFYGPRAIKPQRTNQPTYQTQRDSPLDISMYDNCTTPRMESPSVLLVQTYHNEIRPPMGDYYNVGCVIAEPPCALNLSVKQEVK